MTNVVCFFIGFLFSLNVSLAEELKTLPEFECTVIKMTDIKSGNSIFGERKYPSVELRHYIDGEWLFRAKEIKVNLSPSAVIKKELYLENSVVYNISTNNKKLKFVLVGKSPSREAEVFELSDEPILPKLIAKLTCH